MATKQSKAHPEPVPASVPPDTQQELVEAVVLLCVADPAQPPVPAQSRAMAAAALSHAQDATGLRPEATQVFEQLHAFSVRAPARFVAALAQLDDVAQVMPNALPGSGLIEPVKKRKVRLPD